MTQNKSIRSIRDLRTEHLGLLVKIREETERCARVKYGLGEGQLRMFVHYQPTYCSFLPLSHSVNSDDLILDRSFSRPRRKSLPSSPLPLN